MLVPSMYTTLFGGKRRISSMDLNASRLRCMLRGCLLRHDKRTESPNATGTVQAALSAGRARRATHATDMNASSSRSHELISLRLVASPEASGAAGATLSRLNLVDLAGSERVGRSKVAGQQLAEAQSINKSLSALSDVIAALQAASPHVPFRNSKLTAVLQDALSSSGKVLLVCNVAPEATEVGETLSTLGFAQRAAQVCSTSPVFCLLTHSSVAVARCSRCASPAPFWFAAQRV